MLVLASSGLLMGGCSYDSGVRNWSEDVLLPSGEQFIVKRKIIGNAIVTFIVPEETSEIVASTAGDTQIVRFSKDFSPQSVTKKRDGVDLVLSDSVNRGGVVLKDWFVPGSALQSQTTSFEFSDGAQGTAGTTWTPTDVTLRALDVKGTSGADTLRGVSGYSSTLSGGAGDDLIFAGNAGDILIGGEGSDSLTGGTGVDTFEFKLGDGSDVIQGQSTGHQSQDKIMFGEGVYIEDIVVTRQGSSLLLANKTNTDTITISNWFSATGALTPCIRGVEFNNGSAWSAVQLTEMSLTIKGTAADDTLSGESPYWYTLDGGAGNDSLQGNGGNSTLIGGAGNDSLQGSGGDSTLIGGTGTDTLQAGAGSDTFIFNAGDGSDTVINTIANSGSPDTIQFGEGMTPSSISVRRDGVNLVLTNTSTSDVVTLQDWYLNDTANRFHCVRFADGTWLSSAYLTEQGLIGAGMQGNDYVQILELELGQRLR
jgi:Ca2+-binding RTX toxin-like protein